MGLDMYFDRASNNGRKLALYLQKANKIHNWMLRHFEESEDYNCNDKPMQLDKHDFSELISDIQNVLDDHSLAEQVLPTMDGFFFGDTDYDSFYFEQLSHIHEELSKIEKEINWQDEWLEYSCWW